MFYYALYLFFTQSFAVAVNIPQWRQIFISPSIPFRIARAAAYFPQTNEILLYGGQGNDIYYSDSHSINITSSQIKRLSPNITFIAGRSYPAYTSNPVSGDFFIHGGLQFRSPSAVSSNDFWKYNMYTQNWTKLAVGPGVRNQHCMTYHSFTDSIILFGGWFPHNDEMWTYYVSNDTWVQVTKTSIWPAARCEFACAINQENATFYIQGGWSRHKDSWQYDILAKKWNIIDAGNYFVQRTGHSMKYSPSLNALIIFFGTLSNSNLLPGGALTSNVLIYSFSNRSTGWMSVETVRLNFATTYFFVDYSEKTGEYFYITQSSAYKIAIDNETSVIQLPPEPGPLPSPSSTGSRITTTNAKASPPTFFMPTLPIFTSEPTALPSSATNTTGLIINYGSSFDIAEVLRTFQFYIIGGLVLIVIGLMTCIFLLRRRSKKEMLAKMEEVITTNYYTDNMDSMAIQGSNTTSSSGTTTSEMSNATMVTSEFGLAIPGYLEVNFAKDIRRKSMISKGGFAEVFLADAFNMKLKTFGNPVVVKQIKKVQLSDKDIQIFHQEVSVMEYFKNERNIAKIVGYTERPFCIILKYYRLGSLRNWLKTTTSRTKKHVIVFTRDISRGLLAIHQKGIVHNDLKPENILLDVNPETNSALCVIADFGICQVLTEEVMTVKGFQLPEIRGMSRIYAAPERILHYRQVIAIRALETILSWDLYSLGVVMLELMAKKAAWNSR